MSWDQALNSRMSFTLFSFSVILPSYSCPIFPFVDSDVTNTNSTETGSSSANKFCPTPNLLNMEVSSRRVCTDAKLHEKKFDHMQYVTYTLLSAAPLSPCRDPGDEGLDPELSGEEGGGLRPGEKRAAQ